MQYGILYFPCNVLFMNPFRDWLYSLSCGCMCFSNTIESCLCFRCSGFSCFWNTGFPNASLGERSFAWHCSCHWCLQLSPCIFNGVFVLFITWINRINSSQFSGIFEFGFSIAYSCFSLLCAASPILTQASGHMWSGRDVVWIFVSLLPEHTYPLGGVSFNDVNLVKPVHESDRLLFPSTFQ